MTENPSEQIILAIESAIEGGSISLLRGDLEIDNWIGGDRLSRAEDLLANISELLDRNSLKKTQIDRLAVSVGPGSYTGIRIGLATAIGLKNALNVRCDGVSALEAMASTAAGAKRILCAVPMGRNAVCYQIFDIEKSGNVLSISGPTVTPTIENDIFNAGIDGAILLESIFQRLENGNFFSGKSIPVRNIGQNLAFLIGQSAGQLSDASGLEPLFVSPNM